MKRRTRKTRQTRKTNKWVPSFLLAIYAVIFLAFLAFIFGAYNIILPHFLYRQDKINPQSLDGKFDFQKKLAYFYNKSFSIPTETKEASRPVLSASTDPKRIEVDLTNQKVYAYEGDRQVFNFPVSTGKWGATPTGTFQIWVKLRYTLMSGGSKALGTYYYLPNVPYVMFFHNNQVPKYKGYSLHGTYWHSNFGHPMSHGCINMKTEDVAQLYYWAEPDLKGKTSIYASADNPGTSIIIYGKAPVE